MQRVHDRSSSLWLKTRQCDTRRPGDAVPVRRSPTRLLPAVHSRLRRRPQPISLLDQQSAPIEWQLIARAGVEPGRARRVFHRRGSPIPFATFTLKPLPHTNTLYEFFLRDIRISYSFAMIRDTKRLGIYTISRAFSRRGAIDFRKWSNNRSSGGRKRAADILFFFFFHFRLHAFTYYVHCIFFCVTSLFVRVYTVSPNDCTSVIARRV